MSDFSSINIFDKTGELQESLDYPTLKEFDSYLRHCTLQEKGDYEKYLISPHVHTLAAVATMSGVEDLLLAQCVMLDNLGGGISPEEFAALFPHTRMTVYSSFLSTATTLRFGVYIPSTVPITGEAYEAIVSGILKTVSLSGFRRHGFDMSKLEPTSMFYLPSLPRDPEGRYFKVFNGDGRVPLYKSTN
jgi:hypothetical protein